jgi:hypothetical protein
VAGISPVVTAPLSLIPKLIMGCKYLNWTRRSATSDGSRLAVGDGSGAVYAYPDAIRRSREHETLAKHDYAEPNYQSGEFRGRLRA